MNFVGLWASVFFVLENKYNTFISALQLKLRVSRSFSEKRHSDIVRSSFKLKSRDFKFHLQNNFSIAMSCQTGKSCHRHQIVTLLGPLISKEGFEETFLPYRKTICWQDAQHVFKSPFGITSITLDHGITRIKSSHALKYLKIEVFIQNFPLGYAVTG